MQSGRAIRLSDEDFNKISLIYNIRATLGYGLDLNKCERFIFEDVDLVYLRNDKMNFIYAQQDVNYFIKYGLLDGVVW